MSNKHGDHIWYELMTIDADAARRFFADCGGSPGRGLRAGRRQKLAAR
jgi:hypothetical protein